MVPIGVGTSLSSYVAARERVFAAVRRCHEAVHARGAPRVSTSIRVGTRTDRAQSMDEKLSSLRRAMTEG